MPEASRLTSTKPQLGASPTSVFQETRASKRPSWSTSVVVGSFASSVTVTSTAAVAVAQAPSVTVNVAS